MAAIAENATEERQSFGSMSDLFALSAIGGIASLAFLGAAAPLTLAFGVAALGTGLFAVAERLPQNEVVMASVITAAVTSFVLGFPIDFAREIIQFPVLHETAAGGALTQWSGDFMIPLANDIGEWFGVTPYSDEFPDVPFAE